MQKFDALRRLPRLLSSAASLGARAAPAATPYDAASAFATAHLDCATDDD